MPYDVVVVGVSAGGLQALKAFLPALPASFPLPVAVVQHIGESDDNFRVEYLGRDCALRVKEAEDKEPMASGTVYLAPAGYHLLIEPERCFSLSVDGRVNYSCPSVDVLFESAADALGAGAIGVVLTGANQDGAMGLKAIKDRGGIAIVQHPDDAEAPAMPRAALAAVQADHVVTLGQLAPLLAHLCIL